jgi:hypothetical protein
MPIGQLPHPAPSLADLAAFCHGPSPSTLSPTPRPGRRDSTRSSRPGHRPRVLTTTEERTRPRHDTPPPDACFARWLALMPSTASTRTRASPAYTRFGDNGIARIAEPITASPPRALDERWSRAPRRGRTVRVPRHAGDPAEGPPASQIFADDHWRGPSMGIVHPQEPARDAGVASSCAVSRTARGAYPRRFRDEPSEQSPNIRFGAAGGRQVELSWKVPANQ